MIRQVKTISFKEELIHQNSVPMLFLCDDFELYFCKSLLDNQDYDFLVYELLGSHMAKYFGIATPDIAFVQFDEQSMGSSYFRYNFNLEHGTIIFGSKNIGRNDHLDKTGKFKIKNSKQFSKINNPEDILKIALMDCHLNNCDRNSDNYNLLFQTEQQRFYAIDHAAIFGGPALKSRFVPKGEPSLGQKLLGSYLLHNTLKYITLENIQKIVDNYFSQCDSNLGIEIENVFSLLPKSWEISEGLKERVLAYSLNEIRLKLLKLLISNRLYEIKKKI